MLLGISWRPLWAATLWLLRVGSALWPLLFVYCPLLPLPSCSAFFTRDHIYLDNIEDEQRQFVILPDDIIPEKIEIEFEQKENKENT